MGGVGVRGCDPAQTESVREVRRMACRMPASLARALPPPSAGVASAVSVTGESALLNTRPSYVL